MEKYCQNPLCENEATKQVPVSVGKPGTRKRLCAVYEEVYSWGVQHGRMSKAGLQIEPPPREKGPEPLYRVVYVIDVNAANVPAEDGNLAFAYVNCRQHNTSFKILASRLGVRPRGCSPDELWQKFENSHPGRVVFVLDEVDLISEKDKHKDILYLISRSAHNYMAILLSNNPKFLSPLDESIKSTLQPEIVHFRNYDATEIEQILVERAKVGLKIIPEAIPSQIAAMTAKNTNSDVRVAIKTLYLWALEPQTGLSEHLEKAPRDIVFDMIRDLNDRNLLVLKAVLDESEGFAKDIYQTYRLISAAVHEEPFSYMHFYSNLSYLQSLGLVVLISTKVQRTYANRIRLTFDPSILTAVWTMRFA